MERKNWIGLLGRSRPAALTEALSGTELPGFDWLRPPETGTVMVRGRTGGVGAAFNLGEITATRATLRCADGAEGHALVQGRDAEHARRAALVDALMQGPRGREIRETVLEPLARAEASRREAIARKAEATRVDFETMVRGED